MGSWPGAAESDADLGATEEEGGGAKGREEEEEGAAALESSLIELGQDEKMAPALEPPPDP